MGQVKRLSKKQDDKWTDLLGEVEAQSEKLEVAHNTICEAVEAYNEELTEYNAKVQELRDYRDELLADMQCYYEEKSERWQEGEKGAAYQTWMDEWENLDIPDDFERVEQPDDPTSEFFTRDFCYEPAPLD